MPSCMARAFCQPAMLRSQSLEVLSCLVLRIQERLIYYKNSEYLKSNKIYGSRPFIAKVKILFSASFQNVLIIPAKHEIRSLVREHTGETLPNVLPCIGQMP